VKKHTTIKADDEKCAASLENVYSTERPFTYSTVCNVPPFAIEELVHVAKKMKKGKSTDKIGIVSEMFIHASADVLESLLSYLNEVLRTGKIPSNWFNTHFALLHKGGDVHDVQNWRPIANLNITYRILARLVFYRIVRSLDDHQSEDQFDFRRKRSCAHALFVMECMISKGIEFQVPVWIISIDLKKAFDRIEHHALFQALHEQDVDVEIIKLLERLYSDQHGAVGNFHFRISRGVRQGDVLSPILFNAVLEHAIRKWKLSLSSEGFALSPNSLASRLTNIRYPDDILFFGQLLDEAVSMLESLADVLKLYGLELNMKKRKS